MKKRIRAIGIRKEILEHYNSLDKDDIAITDVEFGINGKKTRIMPTETGNAVEVYAEESLENGRVDDVEKEETEQQKVSDCCGAELLVVETEEDSYDWYACSECRTPCQETEPCDAVKPDDKIEKIKAITDRNLYDKINEIIEKINND